MRAQSGKAWRGHLNRAESVGKGVEAKGASRLGPAPQQPTQGRPCRAPVLWVCKAPRRSPSRGPHGDTHRALRGHPLAEPLESAATARFPASAQCPGDVPTAPSEPHPGSPLLSAKRTASPPPRLPPTPPSWTGAPGPTRPLTGPQSGPALYGTPKARPAMGARWETECECGGVNSVSKGMSIWNARMVPCLETGSLQMPFVKMRPPKSGLALIQWLIEGKCGPRHTGRGYLLPEAEPGAPEAGGGGKDPPGSLRRGRGPAVP